MLSFLLLPTLSPKRKEHVKESLVTSPSCFVTATHDLGSLYLSRERGGETKKNRREDGGVDEKLTISKTVKPGRLWFYGIMVDGCTMKSWLLLLAILSAISHPAGKDFLLIHIMILIACV